MSCEYSRSRAMVRAEQRGVDGVTDSAGGSWRSSTAEKRYFEEGDEDSVDCWESEDDWCGRVLVDIVVVRIDL